MKPSYKKAAAEIVLFDNSDVITTSGGEEINSPHGPWCSKGGYDNPGSGCQDGAHDGRFM